MRNRVTKEYIVNPYPYRHGVCVCVCVYVCVIIFWMAGCGMFQYCCVHLQYLSFFNCFYFSVLSVLLLLLLLLIMHSTVSTGSRVMCKQFSFHLQFTWKKM